MTVTNTEQLDALIKNVKKAQQEYASYTQEQVDKIFHAAAIAAAAMRIPLAKAAALDQGTLDRFSKKAL